MHDQQAFSLVYLYYFKRGGRMGCSPGSDYCYMRMMDDDGNVLGLDPMGVLIPASDYAPDMEWHAIGELVSEWPSVSEVLTGVNLGLLSALVEAHDHAATETTSTEGARRLLREGLEGVAERFGLAVPKA